MQQFGGTVDKFTGDGILAVFGAPVALEDHAVRACLAALGVQEEAQRLAVEVRERDGVDLQLRVGLNSGQVIAGENGSGPFGYTAVGEQVGMAQWMESVAPPGGVMLSVSTARLVEGAAVLGESESVRIQCTDEPVPARLLLGMREDRTVRRAMSAESRAISLLGAGAPGEPIRWSRGERLEQLFERRCDDLLAEGRADALAVDGPAGRLTYVELTRVRISWLGSSPVAIGSAPATGWRCCSTPRFSDMSGCWPP